MGSDDASSRCCVTSWSIIDVVVEANSIWPRITLLSTLCSLFLSLGPYANFDAAARCRTISRAERGLRSFMKMDIFLPQVGSHPDLVTSGGRSCHQPPVLVNLISSTSSASSRMRVRYEETRLRRSCGPWAFSNLSPYFSLLTTIS